MAVQHGIVNVGTTYGWATSVERNRTIETALYADADGDSKGYDCYDAKEEITIEAVYEATAAPPTIGNTITLTIDTASTKYLVQSVKETETNDDFRKVSISAMRWTANTLPA